MKTETKHTPGPWKVTDGTMTSFPDSVYVSGVGRDGFQSVIAILNDDTGTDHDKRANARLIATAPELLEALVSVYDSRNAGPGELQPNWDAIKKLIAKAEGR